VLTAESCRGIWGRCAGGAALPGINHLFIEEKENTHTHPRKSMGWAAQAWVLANTKPPPHPPSLNFPIALGSAQFAFSKVPEPLGGAGKTLRRQGAARRRGQ
jgi:hypothetical protein